MTNTTIAKVTPVIICEEILEITNELKDIEAQIKWLQEAKKAKEIQIEEKKERLIPYAGCSYGNFKIWTKKADSLVIDKDAVIPEKFQRIKIEPDKNSIKKAIAAGETFTGFHIETKEHIQIDILNPFTV